MTIFESKTGSVNTWGEPATLVGYIDKTGNVVIPPNFRVSANENATFSEGLACVYQLVGDQQGYIDKTGYFVITTISAGRPFSEGLASANPVNGGLTGYIDTTGKLVIPYQYTDVWEFKWCTY